MNFLSLTVAVLASQTAPQPEDAGTPYVLSGYAEAFYQWNFNRPSNGLTNARGFDNRHNTFTLSNVALDLQWDTSNVIGEVGLQVGHTPSTYYASEPALPGASATNSSGAELWKYIQQAWVGYRFAKVGNGLSVTAGLYLSPIGPEVIPVKDNWSWSRSNLFFGLPYYHAGARASYALSKEWGVNAYVVNGWNSVVDNNDEKSIIAQFVYTRPTLTLGLLYSTGVERARGAPEGRAWRHLVDASVTWQATDAFSILGHLNAGLEPNTLGLSAWGAGALSLRLKLTSFLWAVVRGDAFFEAVPSGASSIFWPVPWVASGTATLDARPVEHVSFRLEYRHDHAAGPLYFGGQVDGDGLSQPFVPNRASQDTLTLGVVAWF